MATEQNIYLRKGRTALVTVTVTGISDWTDITAKLSGSRKKQGTAVIEIDGTINEVDNTITFDFDAETTSALTGWEFLYEVTLYKDDLTYIKDVIYGTIFISNVVVVDPTS